MSVLQTQWQLSTLCLLRLFLNPGEPECCGTDPGHGSLAVHVPMLHVAPH